MRLDASYYDEAYFRPGPKSSFIFPFTWEVQKAASMKSAHRLKALSNPENALDIGCAKGFLCKALLELGIDAHGCDISEYAVSNCEPEVKGRLKIADIRDGLPYLDNSFDLVCAEATLEHIEMEFLPYVASEIARVSRNHVIIGIPVSQDNTNGPPPLSDPSHRTYMPASYWISLFFNQGLLCDLRMSRLGYEAYPNSVILGPGSDAHSYIYRCGLLVASASYSGASLVFISRASEGLDIQKLSLRGEG